MVNKNNLTGLIILTIFLISSCYQLQNIFTVSENGKTTTNNKSPVGSSNNQVVNTNKPSNVAESNSNSPNQLNIGSQQEKLGNSQQNNNIQTISNSKLSTSSTNQLNTIVQGTNDSLWYNDDWNYRKNITIQSTQFTQSETNFPIYIDIYDKDLKTALTSGYDILFTDSINHKLSYERILFNKFYNSTYTHLIVRLKGNFTNTKITTIMMYWGNAFSPDQSDPKGTWSNGYQAVYHFNSVSSTIVDSTGQYNGTTTMTNTTSQSGIDGNGVLFSGSNYINLGNIASDSWTGLSVEAWYYPTALSSTYSIISKQDTTSTPWSVGSNYQNSVTLQLISTVSTDGSGGTSKSNSFSAFSGTNSWYYIALTWSSATATQYAYVIPGNGVVIPGSKPTSGSSILNSNANALIGASTGGLVGKIDEVRISNVLRTQSYLQDSRYAQLNYKSLVSVSSSYTKLELAGNWSFNQLNYRKAITIS